MNGILQRRERKWSHITFLIFSPLFFVTAYLCSSSNSLNWKSWISKQFCQSMESSLLSWVRCVAKPRSYSLVPRLPLTNWQVGCDTGVSKVNMLMNLVFSSFMPQGYTCWRRFQRGATTYFLYPRYTRIAKFGGRMQTPQANYWCVPALMGSDFQFQHVQYLHCILILCIFS